MYVRLEAIDGILKLWQSPRAPPEEQKQLVAAFFRPLILDLLNAYWDVYSCHTPGVEDISTILMLISLSTTTDAHQEHKMYWVNLLLGILGNGNNVMRLTKATAYDLSLLQQSISTIGMEDATSAIRLLRQHPYAHMMDTGTPVQRNSRDRSKKWDLIPGASVPVVLW